MKKGNSPHNWTKEELAFLKDNYRRLTWDEIANHIGVINSAIQYQASKLGLKLGKGFRGKIKAQPNIEKGIALYKENPDISSNQCAIKTGCTEVSLRKYLNKLGIYRQPPNMIRAKEGEDLFEKYCHDNNLKFEKMTTKTHTYDYIIDETGINVKYTSERLNIADSNLKGMKLNDEYWWFKGGKIFKLRLVEVSKYENVTLV